MLPGDKQARVLETALSHLRETGLDVQFGPGDADALVIRRSEGDIAYEPRVVLMAGVSTAHLSPSSRLPPLIVTPFVTPSTADAWRRQKVAFVDTAGNMFLYGPGLLVDVRGRPRPNGTISTRGVLRSFKNNGLRIIFVLLCDPALAASPYREIAHLSGTSLGTVHGVLTELQEIGYLSATDGVRRLHRSRDLFKRWVDAYALDLFPRLTLATFNAPIPGWWRHSTEEVRADGGQWGAEVAAHLLGSRLLPVRATIYASDTPSKLAIQQRFRRAADDANVEIRERFWSFQLQQDAPTVPTPLIYADLVASGDPREIEAAEYLRENDEALRRLTES